MTSSKPVKVTAQIISLISEALQKINGGYGSVEIIVQDHKIKQISTREITKTDAPIELLSQTSHQIR
jgi:hypothetical protein